MKFEFNLKKILLAILALAILFVPTVIAIVSYNTSADLPVKPDSSSRTSLEVRTPASSYSATEDKDPDGLWKAIGAAIKNSSAVSAIPASAAGDSLLAIYTTQTVEIDADGGERITNTESKQYIFYFTTDYSACYYKDPNGNAFHIQETPAKEFLALDVSAYLFKGGKAPVLTADGTVIDPATLKWHYLAAGNNYKTIENSSSEKAELSANNGHTVKLDFSEEPTTCTLRVYDGTSILFDASYQSMPPINLPKNSKIEYVIHATWNATENGKPYGEASYSFVVDVTVPPVFAIGSTSIQLGDCTALAVFNAKDPSQISFTSEPSLPSAPVFYQTEDGCLGLLPVSYGSAAGTYSLKLSYGGVEETFTLEVANWKYGYKSTDYDISQAMIETLYNDENLAALAKLEADTAKLSSSSIYFSGAFADYPINSVLLGIGRSVKLKNDVQNPQRSFEHSGIDVKAAAGTAVAAMNSGVVAATGKNELLGNYVVIDHGIGLMTWYAHLGEISVATGDAVTAGQNIAVAGSSGFTKPDRIHIGVYVNGVPIAPYGLWEKGLTVPVFGG